MDLNTSDGSEKLSYEDIEVIAKFSAMDLNTSDGSEKLSYEDIEAIAKFIRGKTEIQPEIGIICGSGLGQLAENLDSDKPKVVISYKDIPKFPICHVSSHAGNLVFGYLSQQPVVCMQGRFHFYEGHPPWKITMPVYVMKVIGVKILIVTNAAGGLNSEYRMGDVMVMTDHINLAGLAGFNPLIGHNEDRFGPRFPAMTSAYDKDLRKLTMDTARDIGMSDFIREGVYIHVAGPSYETPVESRFLRMIGADSVGMSTAPEVVVARHCGIRVLGLSLITNMVIMSSDSHQPEPSHKEVMDTANRRARDMQALVKTVIGKLAKSQ